MNKVRYWRNERALSQVELAAATSLPRWTIQLIELDIHQPTPKEREVISAALGINVASIFGEMNTTKDGQNELP